MLLEKLVYIFRKRAEMNFSYYFYINKYTDFHIKSGSKFGLNWAVSMAILQLPKMKRHRQPATGSAWQSFSLRETSSSHA